MEQAPRVRIRQPHFLSSTSELKSNESQPTSRVSTRPVGVHSISGTPSIVTTPSPEIRRVFRTSLPEADFSQNPPSDPPSASSKSDSAQNLNPTSNDFSNASFELFQYQIDRFLKEQQVKLQALSQEPASSSKTSVGLQASTDLTAPFGFVYHLSLSFEQLIAQPSRIFFQHIPPIILTLLYWFCPFFFTYFIAHSSPSFEQFFLHPSWHSNFTSIVSLYLFIAFSWTLLFLSFGACFLYFFNRAVDRKIKNLHKKKRSTP